MLIFVSVVICLLLFSIPVHLAGGIADARDIEGGCFPVSEVLNCPGPTSLGQGRIDEGIQILYKFDNPRQRMS